MFSNSSNDYYIVKNNPNSMNFVKFNEEDNNNNNNYVNNSLQSKNTKSSPFPTKCCVCGYICSGYVYYNVVCCDGCKHFFRRCCNAKEFYKCKDGGNCNVMNVAIKCKSCRFDKCILAGMRIQTIRGFYSRSLPEIYALLEQRRNELRDKGKYIENVETKSETYIKPGPLFINKDNLIIDVLISVEKNAKRVRNSVTRLPSIYYNYSCNSIENLINRKENLISNSDEFSCQERGFISSAAIGFILKNGFFKTPPASLMEDLLLIVDIGKTMPSFNDLDLSDQVNFINKCSEF
ncbi:unnamed protein product [Meloidogyne enterolobii]|uniref:Uncharacterized protein n=2 Tax=Meloidogyne enterolobii TaxID=390850 RepID=A0ACB0XKH1_MELEN